jgi:outer membrane lipase/esterase
MSKTARFALTAAAIALTLLNIPSVADAAGFDQFFAFGDSTLDTGYFRYHLSGNSLFDATMPVVVMQGATGGYAGNGVMNTVILADKFGLSIKPIDVTGGTNYANGGATTVQNDRPDFPNNITTIQQIDNYLNFSNHVANPNAFYLIKSGDNDATYVNNMIAEDPNWLQNHSTYLRDGAAALAVEVEKLQAAGARHIMVRNSYDSALFAGLGGDIAQQNEAAYARSKQLGVWEWQFLAERGIRFIPADNDSLFSFVAHNPTLFGFTPQSVLSENAPYYQTNTAALSLLSPDNHQYFLWIDGVHLTTAGQTIEADYEYSLLTAPSNVSLLGESAIQSGWAHAATIQGQLDPSGRHCRPCGRNFWTSAGAYSLEINGPTGFGDASGTPFGGTIGMDYKLSSGLILGVALTTGSQAPGFSTGGCYTQVDEAPSLYAAYLDGPYWGNAVLTYDLFQDNVQRNVALGIFTDSNRGYTTGQSLALALRGGRNFTWGRYSTGPVAGWILQQARIEGFTETGATGITALSFGSQTRNSAVCQLGWRISADMGRFRPFLEANWNHECASGDRLITTTLTTVTAPSYTMDAVPVVTDWGTTTLGAFYELNARTMLRASASAMYINPQMTTCGGEVGLNFSF